MVLLWLKWNEDFKPRTHWNIFAQSQRICHVWQKNSLVWTVSRTECKAMHSPEHFYPYLTNKYFCLKCEEQSKNVWKNYRFVAFVAYASFFLLISVESMKIFNIFAKQCMFAISLQKSSACYFQFQPDVHTLTFFAKRGDFATFSHKIFRWVRGFRFEGLSKVLVLAMKTV